MYKTFFSKYFHLCRHSPWAFTASTSEQLRSLLLGRNWEPYPYIVWSVALEVGSRETTTQHQRADAGNASLVSVHRGTAKRTGMASRVLSLAICFLSAQAKDTNTVVLLVFVRCGTVAQTEMAT